MKKDKTSKWIGEYEKYGKKIMWHIMKYDVEFCVCAWNGKRKEKKEKFFSFFLAVVVVSMKKRSNGDGNVEISFILREKEEIVTAVKMWKLMIKLRMLNEVFSGGIFGQMGING